ncbi:hypothetical protein LJY25_15980 [Hymenobacter sp. BT175]|uniref:hypothetical protein n=1 Tax=Hymenobacter translucens TaxID=2886507 RepID=UPI001D0EB7B3|nr:hypothetical protein [Hymenobacter translucens]MCC2547948.1 hypothetical protein [Hymenobacter translucens]
MNQHFRFRASVLLAALATVFASACTAPRTITSSGKVTPRGEFKVGGNMAFNISTSTIGNTGSLLKTAAEDAARMDTVRYGKIIDEFQVAALSYILDPVQQSTDLYLRYGVVDRVDVGYKYAFGSHVFDAMYQFLGPVGTPENPGGQSGQTYGSIGIQYATQNSKLPNIPYLGDINDLLQFEASRKDIIVPLVFSNSFGPEEKIGAISYGVVYSHTFMKYAFDPTNIYTGPGSGQVNERLEPLKGFNTKNNYSAFGIFGNAKLGFKYAYVIPAMSVFYQNYGTYKLLNNQTASLKGFTVVPSIGLQFRIPTKRSW